MGSLAERITRAAIRALALWGRASQLRMVQEECGELIAAINRFDRGRPGARDNLIEEIADAHIMLAQARVAFGEDEIDAAIRRKLARFEERLTGAEERARG